MGISTAGEKASLQGPLRIARRILSSTPLSSLFLFFITATIYLLTAHFRSPQIDDTSAAIWPAYQFVHHGTFTLDHVAGLRHNDWFWVVHGHLISARMMGALLSGVPVCALLSWTHLSPTDLNAINAALLSALTIAVLGATFRRLAPPRIAIFAALVVGFGTSIWTVAGSETWPQTGDALWLALMLFAVSRDRLWLAGSALLPAVITRPHLACVSLVVGVGLALARRSRRPLFAFGLPPVVAVGLLLLWNHWYLGQWNVLGVYSAHTQSLTGARNGAVVPYWRGATATLLAPSLGLFVFTPIAALAVYWMARKRRHIPGWAGLALGGGVLYELVQLKVDIFTGGGGFFGGRLIIELVVLASPAAVASYLPWAGGHRIRRLATTVMCAASVSTFAIGARLAWWFVTDPLNRTWTSYYPFRVVHLAGAKGHLAAGTTLAVATAFVVIRAVKIWQAQPTPIVAPRDPVDDQAIAPARESQLH